MSCAELYARASRNEFWDKIVRPVYMNPDVRYEFNYVGILDGFSSVSLPSKELGGVEFKKHYTDSHSQFTLAYERWTGSGQNDQTNFENHCN